MEIDDLFRVFEEEIVRYRLANHLPRRYVAQFSAFDIDLLASIQNLAQKTAQRRRSRPVSHVCSRQCQFVHNPSQTSDIYLCLTTGNMHRCSSQRCNMQIVTKEFRICRRTLQQFPLEFHTGRSRIGYEDGDDALDDGVLNDDTSNLLMAMRMETELDPRTTQGGHKRKRGFQKQLEIRIPARPKRMRFAVFTNSADAKLDLQSPTQREAQTGVPQRLPKSCHAVSSNTFVNKKFAVNLEADARAVITRALITGMTLWANAMMTTNNNKIERRQQQQVKPPNTVVDKIVAQCIFWWQRVIQCTAFLDNAFSYKFPTHCLVMLHLMIDGFRINDYIVVEPVDYVRVALPGGNVLKRNLGIKPNLLTNSEKFFRRCIAEWLDKDKAKVEFTIAENRRLRGHTDEMLRILPPADPVLALPAPMDI